MRALVYRFYDKDDLLLYVGTTTVGPRRWGEHSVSQPWWPLVATIKVQHCDSVAEALLVESEAIAAEQPEHNVIHKSPRRARLLEGRRPSGTGSVFQRRDGKWVAEISIGGRGNRRYVRRYRHSRADAELALAELLTSSR